MSDVQTLSAIFGTKPPKFNKEIPASKEVTGDRFYGVEIEVENCRGDYEYYCKLLNAAGWGVKEDHSLRSSRYGVPWEFVTVPMQYSQLVDALPTFYKKTGFTERNFSDRCSIHVHANVNDYTPDNMGALALYYQTLEDVLFSFVGNHRDSNLYCIPWSQCRMNHDLVTTILAGEFKDKVRTWQKYTALNILPIRSFGTVEFRQMHGSADVTKILNWLFIINRLMEESKSASFEQASDEIKKLSTDKQYEKFFSRFIGEVIPFTEHHHDLLDNGVINAKYSMINFKGEKRAEKQTNPDDPFDLNDRATRLLRDLEVMRTTAQLDIQTQQELQTARERARPVARPRVRPAGIQPFDPRIIELNATNTWAIVDELGNGNVERNN